MTGTALLVVVLLVVGLAVALLTLAALIGRRTVRGRTRERALEPRCRRQAEDLVFERLVPHPRTAAERRLLRDMLLHHLALLRGPEADVIVRYLEEAGHIDELAEQLRTGSADRRAAAADRLGRSRSSQAVAALSAALTDEREDVRVFAARGLAHIGDEAAIGALAAALTAPTRWALAMVADDLVRLGGAAVPALLGIARRGDPRSRAAAARVLGEIGDGRATDVLIDLLRCADEVDSRTQAAAALGKTGGESAADALRHALRDPAWEVRAQAAKALGRLGDRRSVRALEHAMPDPNWWVRVNCGEALARLGEPGLTALRRLTHSNDRYAADQAWAALTIAQRQHARGGPPAQTTHARPPHPVGDTAALSPRTSATPRPALP